MPLTIDTIVAGVKILHNAFHITRGSRSYFSLLYDGDTRVRIIVLHALLHLCEGIHDIAPCAPRCDAYAVGLLAVACA
jgi:hypothetical protein